MFISTHISNCILINESVNSYLFIYYSYLQHPYRVLTHSVAVYHVTMVTMEMRVSRARSSQW